VRRLHLKLYLTIVGTLVAFAFCAAILWHVVAWPQGAAWSIETATYMSASMLNDVRDPVTSQSVVTTLSKELHADVVLLPSDDKTPPITHGYPYVPDARRLSRMGWQYRDGGRSFAVDLEGGRKLIVRPRFRFLFHGIHMVLFLSTLAAILALMVYPIARGITARLARLQQSVQKFGGGDLATRVAVEGKDEVAVLARSFNESAARVEQLVRANQMLLANCSHELRTPLARMRLAIERIGTDGRASAELARNIAELDVLIGELLLTSRLDAAKGLERTEPVDLLALVAEEASHFDREVVGEPVTIQADPLLLRRLVRNLLENARVHAGGASEIRVIGTSRGANIHVDDAGPGIPAEDRERIFEPFYRRPDAAHSTGAGLGLAIVRQIARVHGGDVHYSQREGGGSRFVVTLPGQAGAR
jgi:signal transduction histidine kinase